MVEGVLLNDDDVKHCEDGTVIEVIWSGDKVPYRYIKGSNRFGSPLARDRFGSTAGMLTGIGKYPLTMVKKVN